MLHRLPESIILDRRLQFATEMMRELNRMLEIEIKLSTVVATTRPMSNRSTTSKSHRRDI